MLYALVICAQAYMDCEMHMNLAKDACERKALVITEAFGYRASCVEQVSIDGDRMDMLFGTK